MEDHAEKSLKNAHGRLIIQQCRLRTSDLPERVEIMNLVRSTSAFGQRLRKQEE
jgi:hypothetical protein